MIKIAVIELGKNWYAAFSLNQENPLATIYRGSDRDSKTYIENVLIKRFHSQRNEYKKIGESVPPLVLNGRQQGWKFIWKKPSIVWEKPEEPKPQVETLVDDLGLKITRTRPLEEVAKETAKTLEPMYIATKIVDGGFRFDPITDDIVAESDIPNYMRSHKE